MTAPPGTTVNVVAREFRDATVDSAVVVDGNRPAGLATDLDIAVRIVADNLDPTSTTTEDVMTGDPTTVDLDAGVMDLCRTMFQVGVRRLPVGDGDDLAGTIDDPTVLLVAELSNLSGIVRAESPPG